MGSRGVRNRWLVLAALTLAFVSATASPAFAIKVNWAKPSGPIAYDLKSLQKTYFQASVDTTNCYAVMKVKTGRGDVVIYKGAIPYANRTFTFPAWNGMGPDGKRLTTSNYPWELTIAKGGNVAKATGRIPVTRIIWSVSNSAKDYNHTDSYSKYMLAGKANIYVSARRTEVPMFSGGMTVGITTYKKRVVDGKTITVPYPIRHSFGFAEEALTMGGTWYLAGGEEVINPAGTHAMTVGVDDGVSYKVTFMQ